MLPDSFERASGSYNHQRFNFSNLEFQEILINKFLQVFIVQLVCFDLSHCCQSLHQLLAG